MSPADIAYHRQRETQERLAAERATDYAVRRVHLALADLHARYMQRIEPRASERAYGQVPRDDCQLAL